MVYVATLLSACNPRLSCWRYMLHQNTGIVLLLLCIHCTTHSVTLYRVQSTVYPEYSVCLWCVSSTLSILVGYWQIPHARAQQNRDARLLTDITQTNSTVWFCNSLCVLLQYIMGACAACKHGMLLVLSESCHAFRDMQFDEHQSVFCRLTVTVQV